MTPLDLERNLKNIENLPNHREIEKKSQIQSSFQHINWIKIKG
jgi:hypothetical protein